LSRFEWHELEILIRKVDAEPEVRMSCYHLSRFLFDLKMNDELVQQASTDLDAAMRDYDLSGEEREALRSGDPRKLRQLGVHGMLCLYIKRLSPEFRDNIYWTQK